MSVNTGQSERKMNVDLERLVQLQSVDRKITFKTNLFENTLPSEIEELRAHFEKAKENLQQFDDEMEALHKERKEFEMNVEEIQGSITKAKQKLPEVKTNVEYRAILKEQDNFEKKIIKMEDSQLELMEKMENKSGERADLEKNAHDEKQKFDVNKKEKEEAMAGLKGRLGELQGERDEIIKDIKPDIFAQYEKLSRQRDGIGVAEVIDRSCQSCFQLIQPQLYVLIRSTEDIYSCPHCNRYLYHVPEESEAG